MASPKRKPIPVPVQAEVLFRDRWLCHLCRRPLVLNCALRLLQNVVTAALPGPMPAYWHPNWRRDDAPLLNELGACIDHVVAHARGGVHDPSNFAAACFRCNSRKSKSTTPEYLLRARPWRVKGKHGEPTAWDGLASVFLVLARQDPSALTPIECKWKLELESRLDSSGADFSRRYSTYPLSGT